MNQNGKSPNELLVYVYNVTEDEWPFIESMSHRPKQNALIAECEDASDCYFMSMAMETDFVYISPKNISENYQAYAKQLLGYAKATVIVPKSMSHLVCDDLLRDATAYEQLLDLCEKYSKVNLISYSATSQLYTLADALRLSGINITTPEAPDSPSSWTVNFFGSKSGIRQLAQKSVAAEPDFIMPEGLICVGKNDAVKIAADRYIKQKGVVLKTNKGSGGNGVLIFREGDLPIDYHACELAILAKMNSDKYWDYFPIVVESLVSINLGMSSSLPNVEFKIHKSGRIEFLYACTMKVTADGLFYGVDINEDLLSDRLETRIIDTGYYIAEQYAAAGYRGYFDIDLMVSKNGVVYVCESNCRHTGGTDTYRIAKKLIGKDFMDDAYVLSRSKFDLPRHKAWNLTTLLDSLTPILYDPKKKEGIIINSENSILDGRLIYTIIGKNKKNAYQIEDRMKSLVAEYGLP